MRKDRNAYVLEELGYVKPFYVKDRYDRLYAGLRFGQLYFSEDYNEARTINHPLQFDLIRRYSPGLEITMFEI